MVKLRKSDLTCQDLWQEIF